MVSIPYGNSNSNSAARRSVSGGDTFGTDRPSVVGGDSRSVDSRSGENRTSESRGIPNVMPETINGHIASCSAFFGQCHHAVLIFDAAGHLVFRNESASRRVSTSGSTSDYAEAAVWNTVFESVAKLVAESVRSGQVELSVMIPVRQRCFIVTGSLVSTKSGRTIGALANVSEQDVPQGIPTASPAPSSGYSSATLPVGSVSAAADETSGEELNFQQWLRLRTEARHRMQKLSRRESQVATLVSRGKANKIIARELDISVKTIEKHRANAVRKLGVSSTPEMVRIAVIAERDLTSLNDSTGRSHMGPRTSDSSAGGFGS